MARSERQNEKMREAARELIRAQALRQFSEKGLFAARIQDIAKGAGIAQGLLYHYYPSKDAIYVDLIGDALDRTNEAALAVRDMPATAKEKLRYALRELCSTIERSERFTQTCRLIAHAANTSAIPEQAQRLIEQKRDLPYRAVADIMRQGQAEGDVIEGDCDQLAVLFWTALNGLAIYRATRRDPGPLPDWRMYEKLFLKEESR